MGRSGDGRLKLFQRRRGNNIQKVVDGTLIYGDDFKRHSTNVRYYLERRRTTGIIQTLISSCSLKKGQTSCDTKWTHLEFEQVLQKWKPLKTSLRQSQELSYDPF